MVIWEEYSSMSHHFGTEFLHSDMSFERLILKVFHKFDPKVFGI